MTEALASGGAEADSESDEKGSSAALGANGGSGGLLGRAALLMALRVRLSLDR